MVITNKKYTFDNTQKQRKLWEYLAKIMQATCDAKFSITLNILSLVYNKIEQNFNGIYYYLLLQL